MKPTLAGATWRRQYTGTAIHLSSVAFADARHGWVVGSGGTILATTAGGDSWSPQRSGTRMDLYDVAFADASHGLAVGDTFKGDDPMAQQFIGSVILRTTDGGGDWRPCR